MTLDLRSFARAIGQLEEALVYCNVALTSSDPKLATHLRATSQATRGSDLDLAIDLGQRLSSETESRLHFAFEDSDLPWTVDIVDMQRLEDGIFRQNVERDRVLLDWAL